jgi:hypothetical protein
LAEIRNAAVPQVARRLPNYLRHETGGEQDNTTLARGRFKKPKALGSRTPSVTLPRPNAAIEQFTMYIAAQFNRTTFFLQNETFTKVIVAVDIAYALARAEKQQITAGRARILLACHQAMYSAASCLARGLPLDAAAASRRALEAARTILAIKLDRQNGEKWMAYEERMSRWQARQADQRPPKLRIDYDVLRGDVLADKLATFIGILSDAAVHFTPEFFSRLDFQERKHSSEVFSEYLEADEHQIAQELKMLSAAHLLILKTIARCFGDSLNGPQQLPIALRGIAEAARGLYEKYPFTLRPEVEAELQIQPEPAGSDR